VFTETLRLCRLKAIWSSDPRKTITKTGLSQNEPRTVLQEPIVYLIPFYCTTLSIHYNLSLSSFSF